jgi:hypothetical protein
MRPVRPVTAYTGQEAYPSVVSRALTRRDFLAGGLGLLSAATLGGSSARAAPASHRIEVRLSYRFRFTGCDYVLDKLIVQTREASLAAFLKNKEEAAGIEGAVVQVLRGRACKDVTDRRRLAQLETRLGQALAARFRERLRKYVASPTVTMVLLRWERPIDPGFFRASGIPVPRP